MDQRRQVFNIPVVKSEVGNGVPDKQPAWRLRQDALQRVSAVGWRSRRVRTQHPGPGRTLTQGQLMPVARTSELLCDLYGLNILPATICAWIDAAAQRVASSVEAVKKSIQAAPVVGADESGLSVDSKQQWLPTAVTPLLIWYGVHAKRGMEAIQEPDVLPNRTGTTGA